MKVNYVIASAAHRSGWVADEYGIKGTEILRRHIEELGKTNTSDLSQVTIFRNGFKETGESSYWQIDDALKTLQCPVVLLDTIESYLSYGMWISAVEKYKENFDYYIVIEDDYYPRLNNFVPTLIELHQNLLPNGGYLNSLTASLDPGIGFGAVSNGIIDSKSFMKAIRKCRNPRKFLSAGVHQVYFGYLFAPNVTDYTNYYRTLFRRERGQLLHEEVHDPNLNIKEDIFVPIEYLVQGEKDFPKNGWSIPSWSPEKEAYINNIVKVVEESYGI